jgi:hypothetical protein
MKLKCPAEIRIHKSGLGEKKTSGRRNAGKFTQSTEVKDALPSP